MKILLFCNDLQSAQITFELIKHRVLAGIVVPSSNIELISEIAKSGYVEDKQLFTPDTKNINEIREILNNIKPDAGLIATFPLIFPKNIYSIPPLGFYNFHYGILPKYRSANPIFWQIRNGEKQGGVSVIKIDDTIDGGPLVMQEKFAIEAYDNYSVVLQKSVILAIHLIEPFINKLISGDMELSVQEQAQASYYSKPTINDVRIDWQTMDANEIMATVNAGNPWNRGAITTFNGEEIRIIQVSPARYDKELPDEPGKIVLANLQYGVFVLCKNKELLRIDTIYSNQGYHSGGMILTTGIKEGEIFC